MQTTGLAIPHFAAGVQRNVLLGQAVTPPRATECDNHGLRF